MKTHARNVAKEFLKVTTVAAERVRRRARRNFRCYSRDLNNGDDDLFVLGMTAMSRGSRAMPSAPRQTDILQRKCACGQRTFGEQGCEECKKKRSLTLERHSTSIQAPVAAPPSVHKVLHSP